MFAGESSLGPLCISSPRPDCQGCQQRRAVKAGQSGREVGLASRDPAPGRPPSPVWEEGVSCDGGDDGAGWWLCAPYWVMGWGLESTCPQGLDARSKAVCSLLVLWLGGQVALGKPTPAPMFWEETVWGSPPSHASYLCQRTFISHPCS